jgi:3-(3-hydroxy-phenyl)propionate hydroxylase
MKYDVVIVGFGLVGNVAALLLSQQGLSVAVIERLPLRDMGVAKAGRIDGEVMRIFEQLNLRAAIDKIMSPLKGSQLIDHKGRVLTPISQESWGEYAPMYGFYQPDLQRILQKAAQSDKNIHIWEAAEVVDIEQNSEGVEIQCRPQDSHKKEPSSERSSERKTIKGQYLLVCSGVHTPIAELCELKYINYNYSGSTLNVETSTQEAISYPPFAQTIYDLSLPVTRICNNAHQQRWEFQVEKDNIDKKNISNPERLRELIESLLPKGTNFVIEAVHLYEFDSKILKQWHSGRIIFAGDAAHTMPPYLGLGLSGGIKDSYNIAWKLSLLCRGLATGDDLLISYKGERAAAARRLIELNIWVQRLFSASRLRFLRYLVPLLPKSFLRQRLDVSSYVAYGIVGTSYRLRGYGLPPWPLRSVSGHDMPLDKLLSPNFSIIGYDINPVDAIYTRFIEILASLRCNFLQILPKGESEAPAPRFCQWLHDSSGQAGEWFGKQKVKFIIVRPDHLIFDAARDYLQLDEQLAQLCQKMGLFATQIKRVAYPTDHTEVEDFFEEQAL